jgi:hypothetical protein
MRSARGENLVKFAAIQGDFGHVASKNGCGAVMGKKKLKAVAIVKGTKALHAVDPRGLMQAAEDMSHDLQTDPSARSLYEYGTLPGVVNLSKMGALPIKNYTTNLTSNVAGADMSAWEAPKLRENFDHRGHQCNACGMHHCHMSVIRQGDQKGQIVDEPEYEGWSGCGWAIGAADRDGVAWLNTECDKACVDVNEWGWLCGWVMECQEKGYITREQLGLRAQVGRHQGAARLLQMVSRREGFGNILAEGVKRAAEKLGGAAKDCAIYIEKGATPRGHDHRARWEEMLDTSTSSTATMETRNPVHPTEIGQPARINPFDGEQVAKYVAGLRGRRAFEDSLGICIFTSRVRLEYICRALSAATGWTFTVEEALRFGKRTAAINSRDRAPLRPHRRDGVPVNPVRLDTGRRPRQGAGDPSAVGEDARYLVRRGRLRPEDGQALAENAESAGSRLAREGPLGQQSVSSSRAVPSLAARPSLDPLRAGVLKVCHFLRYGSGGPMAQVIGFIGLGIMGRPMAKNLLKAGYPLVVHNRSRGAVDDLVKAGAKAGTSPRDVASQSDVLITMLPNSPDVEAVVLGRDGVIEGARAGMSLLDMSTISPLVSQKIGAALAAKSVQMLDAPVSGGERGAIDAVLSIMVGGDKALFDRSCRSSRPWARRSRISARSAPAASPSSRTRSSSPST